MYISNEEHGAWRRRRRGNKGRCVNTIGGLTPILRAWLTASSSEDEHADEALVDELTRYFLHESDLLPAILTRTIAVKPQKRTLFANCLFDVKQMNETLTRQSIGLKFGGNISDHRWRQFFSPMFQEQVWFIFH